MSVGGFGFDACPPPLPEDDEDAELVEGGTEAALVEGGTEAAAAVDPLVADICVWAFVGVVL